MNYYEEQIPPNTYQPVEVNGELLLANEPFRVVFNHGNSQEVYDSYFSMNLKCRSRPFEEPTPKAYIMHTVGPGGIQSENHTIVVKMNGRSGNVFIPEFEYEYDNDDNGNMERDTERGGHSIPVQSPPGHDNAEIRRPTHRGMPSGGSQHGPHGNNIQINPRGHNNLLRNQNQGNPHAYLIQNPRGHPIGGYVRGHPIQNPPGHLVEGNARGDVIQAPRGHPVEGGARGDVIQVPRGHPIEGGARSHLVEHHLRFRYILEYLRELPTEFESHEGHVLQDPQVGPGNPNQNDPSGPQILEIPHGGREDHDQAEQRNNRMQDYNLDYNINDDPRGHRVLDPEDHQFKYIPHFRYLSESSNQNDSSDGQILQDPPGGCENPNQNDPHGSQILEDSHSSSEDHDQDDDPNRNIRGDPWSSRILAEQHKKRMQGNHRDYNIEDNPRGHPVLSPRRHQLEQNPRVRYTLRGKLNQYDPRDGYFLQDPHVARGNPNQNDLRGPQILEDPHGGRKDHDPNRNIRGDPRSSRTFAEQRKKRMQGNHRDYNIEDNPRGHRVLDGPRPHSSLGNPREYQIEENPVRLENDTRRKNMQNYHQEPRSSPVFNLQGDLRSRQMQNNSRGSHAKNNPAHRGRFNIQNSRLCMQEQLHARENQDDRRGIRMQDDLRDRYNRNASNGLSAQDLLCILYIRKRLRERAVNIGSYGIQGDVRANHNPNKYREGSSQENSRKYAIEDAPRNQRTQNQLRGRHLENNSQNGPIEEYGFNARRQGNIRSRHLRDKSSGSPNSSYPRGRTQNGFPGRYTQRNSGRFRNLGDSRGVGIAQNPRDTAIQNGTRSRYTDNGPSTNNIQNNPSGSKIHSDSGTPQKEDGNLVQDNPDDKPIDENPQDMLVDDNMLGIVDNEDRNSDTDN